MSRSNNRNLSDIANPNNNLISVSNNDVTITGAGVTQYDSAALLPSSGIITGTQAYVASTGKLYIRGDGGWYNIATVNQSPTMTSVLDSGGGSGPFTLATDGSVTRITTTATDPEGFPITFTATPDANFNNLASVSQDSSGGRIFTITPFSSDSATAESGIITFKASDGVNIASSAQTFTLSFSTQVFNSRFSDLAIGATGNGTTNQNFTDKSSNAASATVNGGSVLAPLNSTFTPFNPAGYCADFSGGNVLTLPHGHTSFDFGTGDFTIEFWFFINSHSGESTVLELRSGVAYTDNLTFNLRDSGNHATYNGMTVYPSSGQGSASLRGHVETMGPINALASTDWTHCALVRSSGTLSLYLNGKIANGVGSKTYTEDVDNDQEITIGGDAASGFNGKIFDFRMVKGTAVYTAEFTPPTDFLENISGTSVLTCRKGWFYDESDNYHEIKIDDGVSALPADVYDAAVYDPTSHGASIYFDATSQRCLSYADNADWDLNTNGSAWCFEFWAYNDDWGPTYNEISLIEHYGNSASAGWTVYGYGRNRIDLYPGVTSSSPNTASIFNDGFVDNMWHHIAFSKNSSNNLGVFINGHRIRYESSYTSIGPDSGTLDIGGRNGNSKNPVDGYMSDIRIVKGSTPYDPTQTTLTVPTAPLTAITNTVFLIGSGNDAGVFDESQNHALILGGNAASSTAVTKFGSSIAFDGNQDYVATATAIPAIGTGDFTIEAWVYQTAVAANAQIFATTTSGTGIGSTWQSGGNITITRPGAAIDHTFSSVGVDTYNTWYHYVVTRSVETIRVYLNGVEKGNATNTTNIASKKMYVGIDGDASASDFTGYIEDFRVSAGVVRYPFEPQRTTLSADSDTFLLALHTSNASTVGGSNWTVTNGGVGPVASNFGPGKDMKSFYFGHANTARIYFDHGGSSSVYNMGDPDNGAADNFSIEFWMWIDEDSFNQQHNIFSTYKGSASSGASNSNSLRILLRDNGDLRVARKTGSGGEDSVDCDKFMQVRTWTHFYYAEEYSGSAMKFGIYVDGKLIGSGSDSGSNHYDMQEISVGGRFDGSDPLRGYLSNLRIQRGTVAFPKAGYNEFTPPTSSFTR